MQPQHRFVNDVIGFAREIGRLQRRGYFRDAGGIQQHAESSRDDVVPQLTVY